MWNLLSITANGMSVVVLQYTVVFNVKTDSSVKVENSNCKLQELLSFLPFGGVVSLTVKKSSLPFLISCFL